MHCLLEVSPSVVAQRLCDLLLSFPASAAGGVQWCVLARKYEERHNARLDIKAIGHSCPLAAATALLWDVLRLVDSEDSDNPIVAVEDAVALTPRPGALGSWPSLYRALCTILVTHGVEEQAEVSTRSLLFSQLKPLLEVHWHANFDETSIGFLSEEGTFVKLKKMKHLIQALIRWRDNRVAWRQSTGAEATAVDNIVFQQLELASSKKHNDLVLRFVPEGTSAKITADIPVPAKVRTLPSQASTTDETSDKCSVASNPEHVPEPCEFHMAETQQTAERSPRTVELEALRVEVAELRRQNEQLLSEKAASTTSSYSISDTVRGASDDKEAPSTRWADIYDDPYEPPPDANMYTGNTFQKMHLPWMMSDASPTCESTNGGSDWSSESPGLSSCGTPMSMKSGMTATCFAIHSGYSTPLHSGYSASLPLTPRPESGPHSGVMTPCVMPQASTSGVMTPGVMSQPSPAAASVGQQVCALVPMWFSLVGDRCVIPGGIVEKFKAKFETEGGSQPGSSQASGAINFSLG